jgi:hypothetical protein
VNVKPTTLHYGISANQKASEIDNQRRCCPLHLRPARQGAVSKKLGMSKVWFITGADIGAGAAKAR